MTTELQRPLSPTERWYWIANQVSPLNAVVRVNLQGAIGAGVLQAAAKALAAEYPVLRVAIASESDGTNPRFVPSSHEIAVRTVTGDGTEWQRQIDTVELATSLDWRAGPLARIVHVEDESADDTHDLVLSLSHIIADGFSTATLLRRLIEHADEASRGGGAPRLSRPSMGPPEHLLPAGYRGARGLVKIAATSIVDALTTAITRPRRLRPESAIPFSQRRTRLLCRKLTAPQLDALTRRCRTEGASVHGAVAAAMAMAIRPAAPGRARDRVCILSPVDIRAELVPPVPADEAGVYVSTVPLTVRLGGDRNLWSIARQVNRSLDRRRRYGQHLALLNASRYASPKSLASSARVMNLSERHSPANVCLSNMGRYEFPSQIGTLAVSDLQGFAGLSVTGYFMAVVYTSHGELHWNFTYIDGVVTEQSAQRLADTALAALLVAIGSDQVSPLRNSR